MDVLFAIALMAACEACDELAKSGPAHPFAISAGWRPKCDAAEAQFVEADPWPRAGEVRRDRFTRDCADVWLTRVFLDADGGFTADEMFAGALIERKLGRGTTQIRQQEFVGRVGSFSYRYSLGADGQKISAAIEAPLMTSHLVSMALAPAVRVNGGAVQSVSCEVWRARCEVLTRRAPDDVALPFFTVQFDKAHPGGDVCIDVPHGSAVSVRAGDAVVAEGLRAPAGAYNACLGDGSRVALETIARAQRVAYRVTRAPGDEATSWDAAELATAGLGEAVGLARFLLEQAVLADTRRVKALKLRGEAEVLLDGAAIPN
jgi:hypothetical protein